MTSMLKTVAVALMISALTLSPAMVNMAQADGINFEGIGSFKADSTPTHGLSLNFSFGGSKDYKKKSAFAEVQKASLTEGQWLGYGLGAVAVIAVIVVASDDGDPAPRNGGAGAN